jgi:hypothetical protein
MGDLIYLEEYKEKIINEEIAELRKELQEIMSTWPHDPGTGYFLSLEDMDKIEKLWDDEKRKL